MTITALKDASKIKKKGVSVITHPDWRWKRCDIKSLNLLANVLAKQYAAEKDAFEAVLVNEKGFITEGASSAFFTIFEDKIHTTPLKENILPSITRKFVLNACKNLGIETVPEHLKPQAAKDADEMFIAVTTKDIIPVISFDGKSISRAQPGKITKSIAEEFIKFTL
jgi:D-alanine transaminase